MVSCRLTAAFVLLFVAVSVGQAGKGVEAVVGLQQITNVLRGAGVSGSLAYSSCGFNKRVPDDLPPMLVAPRYSGLPKDVLSKMFSDDSRMQVTHEEGGMIRMTEKGVPMDILNLEIHHLSFFPSNVSTSDPVHGPQMALLVILESPEVKHFAKAHKIRDLASSSEMRVMPGNCCGRGLIVHGELDDVTVSSALDYVLQTFPGFWVYENCFNKDGERSVYFNFH